MPATRRPQSSIWLRAPFDLELKFWNTSGSMAAADAALYEREGKPGRAIGSWNRALPLAGDRITKEFIAGRLAELSGNVAAMLGERL